MGARRTVATFDNYRDAERAVDHLSDARFPVERVAIVGTGLRFVEQIVGRMTIWHSALRGMMAGAVTGALIGWLFAVFDWFDPTLSRLWLIIDGLWFGAIVGALMGMLAHALTGGARDFASVPAMTAERYELMVDEEVAGEAERLLSEMADRMKPARMSPET